MMKPRDDRWSYRTTVWTLTAKERKLKKKINSVGTRWYGMEKENMEKSKGVDLCSAMGDIVINTSN